MNDLASRLVDFSLRRPRLVTALMAGTTLLLALAALVPSIWPPARALLPPVAVDTDPENMLARDEPVRVFHREMEETFTIHDMVVVGVVNEKDPDGVFNPESLKRIHELARFARTLRWPDPEAEGKTAGVIEVDLISPATVDHLEQAGLGTVRFDWLMPRPPATREEALQVRERARRIPFLDGTLLSEDGKAIALYLPLTRKDLAHRVAVGLQRQIAAMSGPEEYHITGLPVAEDTFGVEMFIQMAISAPVAMAVIFLLLWVFFRKLTLIVPPLIVAMVSALSTMALLIVTGHTIHIMSSMIPIFIMPIAVLDAIHILSEFFDRYGRSRDRRRTIREVVRTLFTPMLFTSLTTAAGFASLALTPIPPVQVFGLFVAAGVMLAWIWTVTFIPAAVTFIPERRLESLAARAGPSTPPRSGLLERLLHGLGRFTFRRARVLLAATVAVAALSAWGIRRIEINDNPTRWFTPSHPIRVADRVLNEHFGGTYMAYLVFSAADPRGELQDEVRAVEEGLEVRRRELEAQGLEGAGVAFAALRAEVARVRGEVTTRAALLERLEAFASRRLEEAADDLYDAWDEAQLAVAAERQRDEVFKDPEVLRYLSALQEHLRAITDARGRTIVGKSNSLSDLVKTVHRELLLGQPEEYRIPDSPAAVAQTLITYQQSHRPQDLWHFVTPDYRQTSLWLQLRSGDNRDMTLVTRAVDRYTAVHPPPRNLSHHWFGLTYINVIWQEKMVSGMLQAFLGSFLVVLLMVVVLFRSALWGILSMIPLTATVGLIYGLIGFAGKDYDMPVAVLSSLSLGLAVDYAIHFLARSRYAVRDHGSWEPAVAAVFGEPARAITRNAIVVGFGFLPLLLAPLVPYKTVGTFIAAILLAAGVATLLVLPALVRVLEPWLFPRARPAALACHWGTCLVLVVGTAALAVINAHQFLHVGWMAATWVAAGAVPFALLACLLLARHEKCRVPAGPAGDGENSEGDAQAPVKGV